MLSFVFHGRNVYTYNMDPLDWRAKKLEDLVIGQTPVDQVLSKSADTPIVDQFNAVAKQFRDWHDASEARQRLLKYRFPAELEPTDESAKVELVLAHEEELIQQSQKLKLLAEKAETVLDEQRWPDLKGLPERVNQLQEITKEQNIGSNLIDRKTEELIEIYNDIIGSFKSNIVIWNQKLEAFEAERKQPKDE